MTSTQALEQARALRDKRAAIMKRLADKWFPNKPEEYATFAEQYEKELIAACIDLDAAALKRAYADGVSNGLSSTQPFISLERIRAEASALERGNK